MNMNILFFIFFFVFIIYISFDWKLILSSREENSYNKHQIKEDKDFIDDFVFLKEIIEEPPLKTELHSTSSILHPLKYKEEPPLKTELHTTGGLNVKINSENISIVNKINLFVNENKWEELVKYICALQLKHHSQEVVDTFDYGVRISMKYGDGIFLLSRLEKYPKLKYSNKIISKLLADYKLIYYNENLKVTEKEKTVKKLGLQKVLLTPKVILDNYKKIESNIDSQGSLSEKVKIENSLSLQKAPLSLKVVLENYKKNIFLNDSKVSIFELKKKWINKEVTYIQLLERREWDEKREEILYRDNYSCQECNCKNSKDNPLQIHHKRYISNNLPWEYESTDLITYCKNCHKNWHLENKVKYYEFFNGYLVESNYVFCTKCDGSGYSPEFKYHRNSVCLNCDGRGILYN